MTAQPLQDPAAQSGPDAAATRRRSTRVAVAADVLLRRSGQLNYRVSARDVSTHGCKLEFIERPRLEETVWVKFEGMGPIQARVSWLGIFEAGLSFEQPIHPAVYQALLQRLAGG